MQLGNRISPQYWERERFRYLYKVDPWALSQLAHVQMSTDLKGKLIHVPFRKLVDQSLLKTVGQKYGYKYTNLPHKADVIAFDHDFINFQATNKLVERLNVFEMLTESATYLQTTTKDYFVKLHEVMPVLPKISQTVEATFFFFQYEKLLQPAVLEEFMYIVKESDKVYARDRVGQYILSHHFLHDPGLFAIFTMLEVTNKTMLVYRTKEYHRKRYFYQSLLLKKHAALGKECNVHGFTIRPYMERQSLSSWPALVETASVMDKRDLYDLGWDLEYCAVLFTPSSVTLSGIINPAAVRKVN